MKILIIQTAFIGDVILATAVAEKLHRHFPKASIAMLVRKGNESLLENHPFLHEILIFDKKKNKNRNLLKLIRTVKRNQYDKVINIQRYFTSGLIAGLSGAKERIGFDKNPMSWLFTRSIPHKIDILNNALHETGRNQMLISHFTDEAPVRPKLYPSREDFEKMRTEESYICIAPASIWFTKQFPKEKWVKLIQKIPGEYRVYLLGGKEDIPLCEAIQTECKTVDIKVFAGQLTFLESAALMKYARMNFVNDSAPMHLASAVNAPVTAIYCSTIPEFGFGPLSQNAHVIEYDGTLACRPCGLHGRKTCPLGHFRCSEIEPDRILAISGL